MTQTYDVQVTTLTYGGDALGRLPDGRAVFVPFSLPGELVRVRLIEEKRRFARAELLEVLTPSPDRVLPLCKHFGRCGVCHYQHMPYEAQLKAKADIVKDQLERIGQLENPPVQPTVPCPDPYYYRNNVQFHLTGEGKLGYHQSQSLAVFAAEECHLPLPPINVVWPQLDFEALPEIERIGLRLGVDDDVLMTLESETPETPEMSIEDLPISVVHLSPAGPIVMAGADHITIEILGRPFHVSAGSFFQINNRVAEAMVEHVLELLNPQPGWTVLDVYCGVGLFSAFLAPRVSRLVGIEESPGATEDFVMNLDEYDNVELYEGAAEEVLPNLDLHPDAVLVDPPRAGLDRRVLDRILELQPPTLVYISCDPATLARDVKRLTAGGYRMQQATPFDMFPQTYHVEAVCLMSKK